MKHIKKFNENISTNLDDLEDCLQEIFDKYSINRYDRFTRIDSNNYYPIDETEGKGFNIELISRFKEIYDEIIRIKPIIEQRIDCEIRIKTQHWSTTTDDGKLDPGEGLNTISIYLNT